MNRDPIDNEEIQRFEHQYRLNPDSLVFARLADAYRKAGDPNRALEVLESGISQHRDYASAHIVRAKACVDLGQPGEAEEAFLRVLELDSANLVALRGLAALARERGDLAAVRQWFQRISGLDSEAPDQATDGQNPGPAAPISPDDQEAREQETDWQGPSRVDPLPQTEEEWWTPDEQATALGGESEDVDSVDGAAAEAWWFEDPSAREPADDGDLLTRTMAELYEKQGLYEEAAAIYRELLRDRPTDVGLRSALAGLETRLAATAPVPAGADEPVAVPADGQAPQQLRPRLVEQPRAAAPASSVSGQSDVFLAWLRRLGE